MTEEQLCSTDLRDRLQALYHDNTKHSNYQNIPAFVREAMGYSETIDEGWRGDTARYRLIVDELRIGPGQVVGDVGANTGFFTLSLAHANPGARFLAYETNPNHADFIRLISDTFGMTNVTVLPVAVDLAGIDNLAQHDVMLHLNVLHHAGHDFDGDLVGSIDDFPGYATAYLRRLSNKSKTLVFQMGSNWGGNKATPIVSVRDDCGKIMLIQRLLVEAGWRVAAIALATHEDSGIVYRQIPTALLDLIGQHAGAATTQPLTDFVSSLGLDRFPGEFYRRPIFLCQTTSNL